MLAFTVEVFARVKVSALVSTAPPFPEDKPPSAVISPANKVEGADVLMTPPLPDSIADTLILD